MALIAKVLLPLSLLLAPGIAAPADAAPDAGLVAASSEPPADAVDADGTVDAGTGLTPGEPELVPPVPIGSLHVPLPLGSPPPTETVTVQVLLRIDATGTVLNVDLVEGAGEPWDQAVLNAAAGFRFEPARWGGTPIPVEIPFVQRFEPPPPPEEEDQELPAVLEGSILEKGTRKPVPHAEVIVEQEGRTLRAESGNDGTFSLRAPAGPCRVEVAVPGYNRFVVRERLSEGERVAVRYLVERRSYDPYETIVIGKAERAEVSRTTLRDRELTRVPGTFGDPFRVVGAMPGVGQVFSLLSYPIVRGSNPGTTGILLDGVRVPQLYHYLAGPGVIHPSFIDRVDFYPGSFPVEYGGYTGGIVDGITRRARPDERIVDAGFDLTNTSVLLRQPTFGDTTATVAGRYGYPGLLLSAFSQDSYASYWDYQTRLDGAAGRGKWTAFAFGSYDEAGNVMDGVKQANLRSQFHRLDLRFRQGDDDTYGSYAISFGIDDLLAGKNAGSIRTLSAEPRIRWQFAAAEGFAVRFGLDGAFRQTELPTLSPDQQGSALDRIDPSIASVGGLVETPWRLTDSLSVIPGARVDLYDTKSASKASFDPRLLWRWRVGEWPDEATMTLKGGVGYYHQPPRFFIPIPGLDELALDLGLPASVQSSLGTEVELATGYLFDVTTYFNWMDPIVLEPNFDSSQTTPEGDPTNGLDNLLTNRKGRSYGVELMLRKMDRGNLFGWIAYTLSRSERLSSRGWEAFDFDRPHMLHVVAGLRLPRNWELGGRMQLQSGRPVRAGDGSLTGRTDPFTRFDIRIDKRAVYNSWMLDFYIDVINVAISPEAVDESSEGKIRYMLPTVGFRAVL
ncbi:TonB family protein [Vulgatibacter incomptus]|uniref:TonB family protein / TonB-dependent receptor n=1 Tax=Vulgatibacter incomptus TaxID=1391653 RepID=A0A0K1PIT7_9BACT|nr:TonB family protein [Vulgatibacter incomptus]AKU93306.1 TonB family protein / TonB-dependent receptor [Vulgatibacter incomptus]